jgi:hypothetical protein
MDYYHHKVKHFGWTWFEYRSTNAISRPRRKDRVPTRLARAFAKKLVRREIENET